MESEFWGQGRDTRHVGQVGIFGFWIRLFSLLLLLVVVSSLLVVLIGSVVEDSNHHSRHSWQ